MFSHFLSISMSLWVGGTADVGTLWRRMPENGRRGSMRGAWWKGAWPTGRRVWGLALRGLLGARGSLGARGRNLRLLVLTMAAALGRLVLGGLGFFWKFGLWELFLGIGLATPFFVGFFEKGFFDLKFIHLEQGFCLALLSPRVIYS